MRTRYRMRNPDGAGFVILIADILLMFVFVVLDMKPTDSTGLTLAILIGFGVSIVPGRLLYSFIRQRLTKKFESDYPDEPEYAFSKANRIAKALDLLALVIVVVMMSAIASLNK